MRDCCGLETDTIIHLFCDCPKVDKISKEIIDWLNSLGYKLGDLTDVQIIFGELTYDPIINRNRLETNSLIFEGKKSLNVKRLQYFLRAKQKIMLLLITILKRNFREYGHLNKLNKSKYPCTMT